MHRVLDSFSAIELGQSTSVRFCGHVLASLGATVIAVRQGGPDGAVGGNAWSNHLDLNKRILYDPAFVDNDGVATIIGSANLVILDWVTWSGRASDWRTLHTQCNMIVLTPFGLCGPGASRPGGDLIVSHGSGYPYCLSATEPGLPPMRGPEGQAELFAGVVAAIAGLAAAVGSGSGHQGRLIDLAEREAMASLLYEEFAAFNRGDLATARAGDRDAVAGGLVGLLPCADGEVVISPREQHQWERLVQLIGSPSWAEDPRFATPAARLSLWPEVRRKLSEWSTKRTRTSVFNLTQSAGIACFPVNSLGELEDVEQLRHRRFWYPSVDSRGQPAAMPRMPWRFDGMEMYEEGPAAPISSAEAHNVLSSKSVQMQRRQQGDLYPLSGVRILDLSWVVAGPVCTRYLARLGAEVVKVESTTRSAYRNRDGLYDDLNRSKYSMTVNLQHPFGQDVFRRLVQRCDVVVENFSTGVMERLGLGYDQLRHENHNIILLSISGMGRTGPAANLVAYGSLLQAYSGWLRYVRQPATRERIRGARPAWTDQVAGAFAAAGVLSGLWHRERSGQGCRIDISMLESIVTLLGMQLSSASAEEFEGDVDGNASVEFCPHGCYPCSGDDQWVAVAVYNDAQWKSLVDVMGNPAWSAGLDTASARLKRRVEIEHRVGEWTKAWGEERLTQLLLRHGIPATKSNDLRSLLADAQLTRRGFFARDERAQLTAGLPWIDSRIGRGRIESAPEVGADTVQVLSALVGLTPSEIDELSQARALD